MKQIGSLPVKIILLAILGLAYWCVQPGIQREMLQDSTPGGPVFAVIPTLGIGGPLAILALLFPSLFGGVLLLFRQWGAFFAVLSINGILYLGQMWLAPSPQDSWFGTQTSLWVGMTLVTFIGLLWAWARQLRIFSPGHQSVEAPPRTELMVLGVMSLSCLVGLLYYWWFPPAVLYTTWVLVFVLSVGIWLATLYWLALAVLVRSAEGRRLRPSTEGMILAGMTLASVFYLTWNGAPRGLSSELLGAEEMDQVAVYKGYWSVPLNLQGAGMVMSSPKIQGDRIYVGVAYPASDPRGGNGALYCIDREKKSISWFFNDQSQMKPVFSSPGLGEGMVYLGEGFHYHENCKLYAINSKTQQKAWEFTTGSQVESSPVVADGKVFVGAGNDGVYAFDAKTGKKIWRYGQEEGKAPLFRVGGTPTVNEGRLYVGSGVDRNYDRASSETAVVCLDNQNGKEIWKVKTGLPCWAAPIIASDQLICALGNGDVFSDAMGEAPAGEILSLKVRTGEELWRFKVPNGILSAPAVDSRCIYFGCRDGYCYCIGRFDGKLRWKRSLESPVVASPALDVGQLRGVRANHVFVVSLVGRVSCLDAQTGKVHWSWHDLEQTAAHCVSSPVVVNIPTEEGMRRQIFFGAGQNNLSLPVLCCVEDLLPVKEKALEQKN